jgi:squalene-hopene/tetraprenyl-beta-curcumene cyclase
LDGGADPNDSRLKGAVEWVYQKQLLVDYGDWKVYRPELEGGGWSFEYENSWYPDIDDTAAVLLALLKQDRNAAYDWRAQRAVRWIIGMQNRDGGWAAFDVDNDKLFLNQIPFSDMDSLCDPSSPDVTGRVLEAFGLLLEIIESHSQQAFPSDLKSAIKNSCDRGVEYIRGSQEKQGSWFGRWGVNYVYGTSNVLCGLARMRIPSSDPMVIRGVEWLKSVQNGDGGWGEGLASYADKNQMGRGDSTASQTAWGLMGLLAYIPATEPAIQNGVRWLLSRQRPPTPDHAKHGDVPVPKARGATWDEPQFTGTGFPNYFYLRYHLYRHYFPMMALGRFQQTYLN